MKLDSLNLKKISESFDGDLGLQIVFSLKFNKNVGKRDKVFVTDISDEHRGVSVCADGEIICRFSFRHRESECKSGVNERNCFRSFIETHGAKQLNEMKGPRDRYRFAVNRCIALAALSF